MKLISTAEAADTLGVRRRHVQLLIKQGKLKAHKVGRFFAIDEKELRIFAAKPRKAGRPRKTNTQ